MRKRKNINIDTLNSGYRYALSLSSSHQDAEDLVHDAWIRLDKRYGKTPEKSLLFTTVRNLYIDRYRHAKKFQFCEFEEYSYEPHTDTFDEITPQEIERFLSMLRDVEREALYLSVVEGYTADEIATLTSSARGTVLSLIHRAKIKLRTHLAGENIHGVHSHSAEVVALVSGKNRNDK